MAYITQHMTDANTKRYFIKNPTGRVIDYQTPSQDGAFYLAELTASYASVWEKCGGDQLVDASAPRPAEVAWDQMEALDAQVDAVNLFTNRLARPEDDMVRAPLLYVIRYKEDGNERAVACVILHDHTPLIISVPILMTEHTPTVASNTANVISARWMGVGTTFSLASDELKKNRFIEHFLGSDEAQLMRGSLHGALSQAHSDADYIKVCQDFVRAAELIEEHKAKLKAANVK